MWYLKQTDFDPSRQSVEESLYTIGNGYIGIRGCFEEERSRKGSIRGSYINGLYDRVPMVYGESAYGFPQIQDKQPKIADTQTCEVRLDGETIALTVQPNQNFKGYERILDYKKGISTRKYAYRTATGKWAQLEFSRLASLTQREVFVYEISVTFDGQIELISLLDLDIENYGDEKDPRVGKGHGKLMDCIYLDCDDSRMLAMGVLRTKSTLIEQATVVEHQVASPCDVSYFSRKSETAIETHIIGQQSVKLSKVCTFTDGIREQKPLQTALQINDSLLVDTLRREQEQFLNRYWDETDIVIKSAKSAEQDQIAIRFMLYQLIQSLGRDAYSNMSAKGLSGEGYEGHYFWDTEIYVLPLLQILQPKLAKSLLAYRYRTLDAARERALELGHTKGASYPWRTISGIECSGYFPAGTAQYHINADIAYAFIQHYLCDLDDNFLLEMGAEVILETARTWMEIGNFQDNRFLIHDVTGPDEYTAVVNNNYYTNAMAKYHLYWAEKIYRHLVSVPDASAHEAFKSLCRRIDLKETEVNLMKRASEQMYLPHDDLLGIDAQDDSFLKKPIWPFDKTPASKHPLLLHYHPLTIYRHQVLKQADTVLAHYLLEDYTDEQTLLRSYDYYESVTTHDSSLSSCVYGIMAARCGLSEKAYSYFKTSSELDLLDTHGNTKDGLHMANISGTPLSVISGFAGLRITEEGLRFRPVLPKKWVEYSFKVSYQGRSVKVIACRNQAEEDCFIFELSIITGEPLKIMIYDAAYRLENSLKLPIEMNRRV